ncbi:MAG TPA: hypothetical protein PKI46_08430 [Bacteroidales bacterium]|nr:hypothetical protein [Bacteroidales bacterium]
MIDEFIRNTENIYLVDSSLRDVLKLYDNYTNNRKAYYYSMYEFFMKRNDKQRSTYYLTLWEGEK